MGRPLRKTPRRFYFSYFHYAKKATLRQWRNADKHRRKQNLHTPPRPVNVDPLKRPYTASYFPEFHAPDTINGTGVNIRERKPKRIVSGESLTKFTPKYRAGDLRIERLRSRNKETDTVSFFWPEPSSPDTFQMDRYRALLRKLTLRRRRR